MRVNSCNFSFGLAPRLSHQVDISFMPHDLSGLVPVILGKGMVSFRDSDPVWSCWVEYNTSFCHHNHGRRYPKVSPTALVLQTPAQLDVSQHPLKVTVSCPIRHGWKLSPGLLINIEWCQAYKCCGHRLGSLLICNPTAVLSPSRYLIQSTNI